MCCFQKQTVFLLTFELGHNSYLANYFSSNCQKGILFYLSIGSILLLRLFWLKIFHCDLITIVNTTYNIVGDQDVT